MSEDNFNTPLRGQEKEYPDTSCRRQEDKSQIKSEKEAENQQASYEELLNRYEAELETIQKELQQVAQNKKNLDQDSEEYRELENRRRNLKKQAIQLNYDHDRAFRKLKKTRIQTQKKQREETQRKITQKINAQRENRQNQILERSRRLQEIKNGSPKKQEKVERHIQFSESNEIKEDEPKEENQKRKITDSQIVNDQEPEKNKQRQQKSSEAELADAIYRARIAEIQLELSNQSLRRSRQFALEIQLTELRRHPYPYRPSVFSPVYYPFGLYYPRYPLYRLPPPSLYYPYYPYI